ncbi:MAG: Minf_1886 family protein [Planctomycetota bacterium]
MTNPIFEKLMEVVESDRKFGLGAYQFVFEGLEYTLRKLPVRRHISGGELVDGLRELALQHFGMLAQTVLRQWGVTRTADFGEIVFRLVDAGLMGKTESDSMTDFTDVFEFGEAFGQGALALPLYASGGEEPTGAV